jgi:hypothetical protein
MPHSRPERPGRRSTPGGHEEAQRGKRNLYRDALHLGLVMCHHPMPRGNGRYPFSGSLPEGLRQGVIFHLSWTNQPTRLRSSDNRCGCHQHRGAALASEGDDCLFARAGAFIGRGPIRIYLDKVHVDEITWKI